MPVYDRKYQLSSAQAFGNAGDEYSDDEVNFGIVTPGVNVGGQFGLHMVVTTTFTDLDSGAELWIVHGAATTPTTKLSGMFIPVASLVAGAHFFCPCATTPALQYARALFGVVSENATLGNATCWFGPGPDGAAD